MQKKQAHNLRLTLRQLQIFAAVAHAGSTSAGGTEIALSQSATSAAINELERLLSVPLFDRVGKRLVLNTNGRVVLERAQALLDSASQIEQLIHNKNLHHQALRIGASTTIGNYVLPNLLTHFFDGYHTKASTWQSSVTIDNTAEISNLVANYDLDIGLIEGPCHENRVQVQSWIRDEMVLVVPVESAAAHNNTANFSGKNTVNVSNRRAAKLPKATVELSIEQLKNFAWLVREPGSGTREATDHALLPFLGSYKRCIELGSTQAILQGVAAGLGMACLSKWAVEEWVKSGRLQIAATPIPTWRRQCYWITPHDKKTTDSLTHFINILNKFALDSATAEYSHGFRFD